MSLILEYQITIITDDEGQGQMSDEDLEKIIDKDVKRWAPSLATMPLIERYNIDPL